jgi:hypothetical protein
LAALSIVVRPGRRPPVALAAAVVACLADADCCTEHRRPPRPTQIAVEKPVIANRPPRERNNWLFDSDLRRAAPDGPRGGQRST